MKKQRVKNKVPRLTTDKQAEAFLSNDLSHLDFSQFKSVLFEFEKKNQQINMRVPEPLLAAVKARAKARGIPYTRFIRETLEQALSVSK
jgi:predicted DNA binding CopG/RHH family protein